MYWRVPPGYPRPFPMEPWFFAPPWPYRWRRPIKGAEKSQAQSAPEVVSTDLKETPVPRADREEKPTQKADLAVDSPSQNLDPAAPSNRESIPAQEDKGKRGNADAKEPSAGPLKWHFPQ